MEYLTSSLLRTHTGLHHGFFTRNGGVSGPPYDSLNCGFLTADDTDSVMQNRTRVAAVMGVDIDRLCTPRQIHSNTVLTIDTSFGPQPPRADGLVTRSLGLALGVLGADCAPVLLSCPTAGVIGAVHAGWRGALDGVLEAALDRFADLGAGAGNTCAAIGPCIQAESYEVGPEFHACFVGRGAAHARCFAPGRCDRWLFDLPAFIEMRLRAAGVAEVEQLATDTLSDSKRFFSYRRSQLDGDTDCGRQISVIMLR